MCDIRRNKKHAQWAVFGVGGFIGSALVRHLNTQGVRVAPLSAPRLRSSPSSSANDLLNQLEEYDETIQGIATELEGIRVVVNAAGLALPNASATESLFGANSLLPLVLA